MLVGFGATRDEYPLSRVPVLGTGIFDFGDRDLRFGDRDFSAGKEIFRGFGVSGTEYFGSSVNQF